MALTDENGFVATMPMAPAYGNGGFGGFGGGDGWWILLLLLAFGGGFGGFGGWGMGAGMMGMDFLYPWLNNSQNVNDGFRDQMLNTQVASIGDKITSGFGDLATQLCGGFAGVNAGIANAAAQAEISANARQMANMQQLFGVQSSLQNCCCENRAGLADLKYTVATENCADRAALSDGIRDILAATQAQTQTILDKMCAKEIEDLRAQNVALQNQVNMQNLAASQAAQTAALVADNTAQTQYIVNRVAPYPVPAYVVANPVTPAI